MMASMSCERERKSAGAAHGTLYCPIERESTYRHRTLPPNIPGDIQGILAIYPKYTANIPGGEYTPNIPQSIQTGDDSSTSMVT